MKKPKISAIVAIDEKRGIGKDNKLLFHIKEDFERMHKIIAGHPLIMGRKTHDSIGRIISGAVNIVITRDPDYAKKHTEGCVIVHSFDEALERVKDFETHGEIFIFGGGEIYKQAMPCIQKLYLTIVKGDFHADTFFPDYSEFKKVVFQSEEKESKGLKYRFLDLERLKQLKNKQSTKALLDLAGIIPKGSGLPSDLSKKHNEYTWGGEERV